ncbi:hypothetical protein MKA58_09345 [[Clostridium] innocuum]|nr:hypothetical protein [[Clostridium] innocuum]
MNKTAKEMMDEQDILYQRLIRLGEMIGDGLHYEPGGSWITKEYKRTARALGILPKRDTVSIDKYMEKRVNDIDCQCGGNLIQVRKGSFVAKCAACGNKYKLGKRRK